MGEGVVDHQVVDVAGRHAGVREGLLGGAPDQSGPQGILDTGWAHDAGLYRASGPHHVDGRGSEVVGAFRGCHHHCSARI